jgi:hypothetical protein
MSDDDEDDERDVDAASWRELFAQAAAEAGHAQPLAEAAVVHDEPPPQPSRKRQKKEDGGAPAAAREEEQYEADMLAIDYERAARDAAHAERLHHFDPAQCPICKHGARIRAAQQKGGGGGGAASVRGAFNIMTLLHAEQLGLQSEETLDADLAAAWNRVAPADVARLDAVDVRCHRRHCDRSRHYHCAQVRQNVVDLCDVRDQLKREIFVRPIAPPPMDGGVGGADGGVDPFRELLGGPSSDSSAAAQPPPAPRFGVDVPQNHDEHNRALRTNPAKVRVLLSVMKEVRDQVKTLESIGGLVDAPLIVLDPITGDAVQRSGAKATTSAAASSSSSSLNAFASPSAAPAFR